MKSDRVEALMQGVTVSGVDPHYAGYFRCFEQQAFYEAHDVLEALWLKTGGGDYFFFKGLIQAAGAFVHLQKGRLRPASQLFELAGKHLRPFRPHHRDLDVEAFLRQNQVFHEVLKASRFTVNPLLNHRPSVRGMIPFFGDLRH